MTKAEQETKWKASMQSCAASLDGLAGASTESERTAARGWWVVCMASQCGRCTKEFQQFNQEAASQAASHSSSSPENLFNLASFNSLCECVQQAGQLALMVVHTDDMARCREGPRC